MYTEWDLTERVHGAWASIVQPLLQAFFTGIVMGIGTGALAWFAGYPVWKYAFTAWALTQAVLWLWHLSKWSSLVSALERTVQRDINGDGYVGTPQEEPEATTGRVKVELTSEDGRQTQYADLPVKESTMVQIAKAVLAGISFSEGSLTGAGAPLSRGQFEKLRGEFMKRGWMTWRHPEAPAQGVTLTGAGKAVMRQFASMDDGPLPHLQ